MAQQQLKTKSPQVLKLSVDCGCQLQWYQQKHKIENWEKTVALFLVDIFLPISEHIVFKFEHHLSRTKCAN